MQDWNITDKSEGLENAGLEMTEIKSAGVSVIRRHILVARHDEMQNDTRIRASVAGHDAGSYTRMQFLRAINHSLGAHTDAFDIAVEITDDECDDEQQQQQPDQATTAVTSDNTTVTLAQSVGDTCVVCLMAPRDGVALVPCGRSRFCGACAATVATMDNGCPVCRTRIDMVMRLYS